MTVQQGATPLNAERCLWSLSLVNTVASFKALINNQDVPVLSKEQQHPTLTQQNAYFLFCYHYYFYWFSNNCALRSKTVSPCFGFFFMFFFWQFSRDVLNMLSTRLMICLFSSSPPTLSQTCELFLLSPSVTLLLGDGSLYIVLVPSSCSPLSWCSFGWTFKSAPEFSWMQQL